MIRTRALCALSVCLIAFALASSAPRAVSSTLVISQVYGGGGNTGAPLSNDFIEIFNRGTSPISLNGLSVQYGSSGGTIGTNGLLTLLPDVTLQPGQYFLIQQAAGANNPGALPTPDAVGGIAMAATAGKVALVTGTAALGCGSSTAVCSAAQLARIIDLVGYGGASFFETAPTAAPANPTAVLRGDGGCKETDNNAADFTVAAPAPRNSASPFNVCDGPPALSINDVTVVEGHSGTVTARFTVSLSGPAPVGGVAFSLATADDTATTADNDYIANAVDGLIPAGLQSFTFDVIVNGDTTVEASESFFVNVSNIAGAVAADVRGIGTITNDDEPPTTFDVVISQVYGGGGNSGAAFSHDFVELFNRGTTTVNLAAWSVQYASANGTSWSPTPLTGSIAPGGYYLIQLATVPSTTAPSLPAANASGSTNLSASSGKVALVPRNTALIGACPAATQFVDLVGYGTANCFEGTGAANGPANSTAAHRHRAGCIDTNDNNADFWTGAPLPRNAASPINTCSAPTTVAIGAIQGNTSVTPFLGRDVQTSGVVTALKSNGFFMQSTTADEDPATSEGIFVFTGAAPAVVAGDVVSATGTAVEFFTMTELQSGFAGSTTVLSSGAELPDAVALNGILHPGTTSALLERYEGMRLHADVMRSVGPTNGDGEVFVVLGDVPRPMREPGIDASFTIPPDPVTGIVDCCIPRWDENRERITLDTDGVLGAARLNVTSNVTFTNVTGPLEFSFGSFKLLPERTPTVTDNMAAVAVPAAATNEFTVAGFNIENFANNATQRRKAALGIRDVMRSPDIIGVIEIASLTALEGLANEVNDLALAAGEPNPMYVARLIPAPGGGTQHVGFLVKSSRVTIQTVTQELATEMFDGDELHDRPPLVLRATIDAGSANAGDVIVVVNHLRSFIDVEALTPTGTRVRAKRTLQAESVARLLQQLQTANPATPVVSVGDYNAYEFSDGFTDPIRILKGQATSTDELVVQGSPDLVSPDFINLTDTLPAPQRYSFVFEGTPQALDHVLVNTAAAGVLQRYAIARMNADFPEAAAGLATVPDRNSDHDAPVAYFALPGTPVVTLVGDASIVHEAFTPFVDPGATAQDNRGPLPVTVSGAVNVNVPGIYTLTYTATNGLKTSSITRTVTVVDSRPPAIAGFAITPSDLGSPNHTMIDVLATYTATDASGPVACRLSVTSNEALNATGDGNTATDWQVLDPTHVQLRAERSGRGAGRVYTVTVTCTDATGNVATRSATAVVGK